MKAMIMAAGRGQRMRPLTDVAPKPLLEVAGKALLDYHIEALVKAGFKQLVINVAWLGDQIIAHVGDGSRYGCDIAISVEEEALESGGGVVKALPLLGDEPFLVTNGDVFCDYDYSLLRSKSLGQNLAHLVLVENPGHNLQGDFLLRNDRVLSGQANYTFSGIRLLSPQLFQDLEPHCFSVVPLLREAVTRGKVSGELHQGLWHDIGTPERLQAINQTFNAG